MAGIDLNTVQQDLARRFAAPLPEFYKRRIIFWYDEDREFEDQLEDMKLDGVKVVALTGNNTFAVKKLLCEDDTASNYLVYDPRSFMKDDDNWLINVQIYSEEFRADLNSIWMDEMGLPATPIIRNQVKNYRKFFRAKDRREAVKKLSSTDVLKLIQKEYPSIPINQSTKIHLGFAMKELGYENSKTGNVVFYRAVPLKAA